MHSTSVDNRPFLKFPVLSMGLFAAFGAALVLVSPDTFEWSTREGVSLGVFLFLAILAEVFPLNLGAGKASIGFSGVVYWVLIIVYPPFWAAGCAAAAIVVSEILIRRKRVVKALFNAAQVGLSVLAASVTFVLIHGDTRLDSAPTYFMAYLAAVFVYWFVNTWAVSAGASILYDESIARFWKRNFEWEWIYELSSAPIALAVAFAYSKLWIVGLGLVVLPLFMLRLAYSQYLDLKRTYRETVRTLIKVIEMHDPYTAGHSDRVAHYARELCEALSLSPAQTEKIELAAYLHDVGKIHLDLTGIVRKAGKLTEEERRLVRLHPVMSADLANQVSYFQGEIEAMIRHHHENWDGSGYPHGLVGEEIPQGARIILLADSFDAMTTSRVYREALDIEFVKEEFTKFAGIQFDPEMVPVFLSKVVRNGDGIVSKPLDEPLEGQRARAPEVVARQQEIRTIPRRGVM